MTAAVALQSEPTPGSPLQILRPRLDLSVLQRSFDHIPRDRHFEGGYRCRTQSRFSIQGDTLTLLPTLPLFQTLEINPLEGYGGIVRDYADVPAWLAESPDFLALVKAWLATVPLKVDTFSAHQIRTEGSGETVPEGRHRDGYDWIAVFVVRRHAIAPQSAKTTVWRGRTDEVLFEGVLQPGEIACLDDQALTHFTSGLVPETDGSFRDVFILTVPDHSAALPQAKDA